MGGGHIFLTACGFGKRVVAIAAPFSCVRHPDDRLVFKVGNEERSILPDASPEDGLSDDCEVANVIEGPRIGDWLLDAQRYRLSFPEGWTVEATGTISPIFFLCGAEDETVFVQTASKIPSIDELVVTGETIVERGRQGTFEWIEVSYGYEGREWRQRRTIVGAGSTPLGIVVAQAPTDQFARARALQIDVAEKLVFRTDTP